MPDEEKVAWVTLASVGLGMLAFAAMALIRMLDGMPVDDQNYSFSMIACIFVMLIPVWAMRATLLRRNEDAELVQDERDRLITRRADQARYRVLLLACVVVLSLAFNENGHFWIASAVFAGLGLSHLVGTGVQIGSYRRGVAA